MKSICSNGGPLIGISRDIAHLWSGIDGKSFIGEASKFTSDYDAACDLVAGVRHAPCNIAKLKGVTQEALLITMPVETAIISSDPGHVQVAQVEAADPDWSFEAIDLNSFDYRSSDEKFLIYLNSDSFVIFDATCRVDEVRDDMLECKMERGIYKCFNITYLEEETAILNLIRLTRA